MSRSADWPVNTSTNDVEHIEDDEYEEYEDDHEEEHEAEEDHEEEDDDDNSEQSDEDQDRSSSAIPAKRRGRPPKYPPVEDGGLSDIKRIRFEEPKIKGRRGRKPAIAPEGSLTTANGRVLRVTDDEYDLSEDEEGETKVTKDGVLVDNRQYRVRTFKVKGKGNRLYMLSTEPARCMGFRDSYLLFQKHRLLYKVVLTQEEKYDLIDRDIIPHSYKGRVIGLVTARSVYREFGAKIVVGGKWITDDYYSTKLRELGRVQEGTVADPVDVVPPEGVPYNRNQFVAWHGASQVYHQSMLVSTPQPSHESMELASVKLLKQAPNMSEENWMYLHAQSVRDFEKALAQGRTVIQRGIRDAYTGLTFVPGATQPTQVVYRAGKSKRLIYETKMQLKGLKPSVGLLDVPRELFDDCVSEEVKQAILEQQEYEKLE